MNCSSIKSGWSPKAFLPAINFINSPEASPKPAPPAVPKIGDIVLPAIAADVDKVKGIRSPDIEGISPKSAPSLFTL